MNATVEWTDRVPEREGVKSTINEVAFSPDGTRLIAAVGNRVLLYDAESGNLLDSLRGHKDTVLTVSYNFDGSRFASGGADKVVVIWKGTGQGLLKYNHTSPIQRVRYSPVALELLSCADDDFGVWTPTQKQVPKEKVSSKILSSAWNMDGTLIAVGLQNGIITVRSNKSEEICRIERNAPVWCLTFAMGIVSNTGGKAGPGASTIDTEVLMVGCWDKTVSSYRIVPPPATSASGNARGSAIKASERNVKFYPTSISITGGIHSKNSFLLITGGNKKCILFSRDIMKLTEISSKNSWIWSCSTPHYGTTSSKVVTGSDNGDIEVLDLRFDNIYAINPERYAYRENLTEIVVQHLFTDRKVRIKCRDLVKKLALYKNKLAVQVSDKVFIYESNSEDLNDIHFRLKKERVTYNIESSSMGIIINYLLFSHQNTVSTYTFDGIKTRTWTFESKVKYFNVDCGLVDKECVIVCLQNGVIYKIFIDNPFPLEISRREPTKIGNKLVAPPSVICADMNLHRNLIATVDEKTNLVVSDLNTHDVLFKYSGAKHVCFNREVDDMLCFSTDVSMYVVSGISGGNKPVVTPSSNFTGVRDRNKSNQKNDEIDIEVRSKAGDEIVPQEQHIGGPATALVFSGQRLFCLYRGLMTNLDIPQGNNILSAIEANDYDHGYHLACLGATSADWRLLGMRALRANQLNIAKNCFSRLQDTKYLNLLEMIESNRGGIAPAKSPEKRNKNFNLNANTKQIVPPLDNAWVSEILAYEGHALDAAKLCARSGKTTEAVRILTELRRWNDAKLFAQSSNNNSIDLNELTLKQAKWLQEISDWKGAAELHITLGQYMNACKIIVDSNKSNENLGVTNNTWKSYLLDVMRRTPKELTDVLTYCGDTFVEVDEDEMAKETYTKLNDISKLMYLFGRKQMWVEAAKLAEDHPGEFDCSVFLPYAEWLVSQDQFMDAVNAYKKANRSDLARKILEELTYNSVVESRFKDAAYFYWLLSREYESLALELMNSNNNLNASMGSKHASLTIEQCELSQMEAEHKADLYYAYSTIHSYIMDPFTTHLPDTLFQVCRFIINSIGEHNNAVVPYGISKASTYYTLGKQAMKIGCFKLARYAYEKLNKLTLTLKTHEAEIDLDMLIIQAKPIHDNPDYSPACYRCGAMNPLLNPFTNKHAKGDVCSSCGHPFVRSFISFDILPLVEFVPEPSISDDEAIELIRSPNDSNAIADMKLHSMKGERDGWKESKDEKTNANIMSLDDEPEEYNDAMLTGNSRMSSGFNDDYAGGGFGSQHGVDLFTRCLNRTIDKQNNAGYMPVTVDANTLLAMKRGEVYVCKPSCNRKRATFYRNMLPDIAIAISQPCHRFFHLEDFEFSYLSEQRCPYSRLTNIGEYGSL